MGEKGAKLCLLTINVIVMMAGVAMFVGGLLIEYTDLAKTILSTVDPTLSLTELGVIGVVMVAVGAFVILVSFVGCCGAVSESRCMLGLYFVFIAILFFCQIGLTIASFVYGSKTVYSQIEQQLQRLVNGYKDGTTEAGTIDLIQGFFGCCGYNGTSDYKNYNVSATTISPNATTVTMAMSLRTSAPASASTNNGTTPVYYGNLWPQSCCKKTASGMYENKMKCLNASLPLSERNMFTNTKGCTMEIENWVHQNLLYIGIVCAVIAAIELATMATACSLRRQLD